MIQEPGVDEIVLPTYAVLARFRQDAPDGDEAVRLVAARLSAAGEPFQDVLVERQEGPRTWMVVARFVVVSIDGHTAVGGVVETLALSGLDPDEAWVDGQVV